MTNRSPISVVNKKRNTYKNHKSQKSSGHNPKKPHKKGLVVPGWVYRLFMIVISMGFVLAFYYFFIRPYEYRWKPCYGLKAYGICMPDGYDIHGIDVSHYQGEINWKELSNVQQGKFPIKFIFMKASEGGDHGDKVFISNFDSARIYGFMRGAYHFYNPNTDASKQAQFFINSVKLEKGDLPPVLDIEKKGNDVRKLQSDLKIWLKIIERHYGVKPIIYASYKFKCDYLNDSVFNSYPYWIAHYYVDSIRYDGNWDFWQHTDVGYVPGIKEKVDLDVFNGSIEDLKKLAIQ